METHAFGFRLRANAPEGQKRFPISGSGVAYRCVRGEISLVRIRNVSRSERQVTPPKEAHGSDHGWKAMKNSKRLRIFAVLLPASFPGCGGDGDRTTTAPCSRRPHLFLTSCRGRLENHALQIPTSLGATAVTQRYAIDVPMPIGTQVFAIRSGVNLVLVRGTTMGRSHATHTSHSWERSCSWAMGSRRGN